LFAACSQFANVAGDRAAALSDASHISAASTPAIEIA
jgi:hypothetical protein